MAIFKLPHRSAVVQAVGFDVDGVLRDTGFMAFQNCRMAIRELGGNPPNFEDFVHGWGGSLEQYFRHCGVKKPDHQIREVNQRYLSSHDTVGPYPDVAAAVAHLESLGLQVFALSGHSTVKIQQWFEEHDLHLRFRRIQGDGRDKTGELVSLCERLSVEPREACYLGDWAQDMRAAKSAKLMPVGVTRGHKTQRILRANGAEHVVEHLHELTQLIR